MKNLLVVIIGLLFFSCNDATMQSQLTALETDLSDTKIQLDAANAQLQYQPGLIHNVFFWLNPELTEAEKAAFLDGVKSLKTISTVRKCYIGPPASTEDRDVVDNSYSYALLVHFDDVAGQNAYQVDPIHLKFVEDHKDKWTKVIVYDNVVSE